MRNVLERGLEFGVGCLGLSDVCEKHLSECLGIRITILRILFRFVCLCLVWRETVDKCIGILFKGFGVCLVFGARNIFVRGLGFVCLG